MTTAIVRTHPQASTLGSDIALDLFNDDIPATVHIAKDFHASEGAPIPEANEVLLALAASTYVLDKAVSREATPTRWTREFDLAIPRHDKHSPGPDKLSKTLTFLTGDEWRIKEVDKYQAWSDKVPDFSGYDAVCLFSGGLDSYCGAIGLLSRGLRVVLVGHHDGGITGKPQKDLADALDELYPDQLVLHQGNVGVREDEPRGVKAIENTHRSRSLLFIALGLAIAGAIGNNVPLYVPENGPISLNVPLTAARRGTASTRTTHPHYLRLLDAMITHMGIDNPIVNPFQLMTKGELTETKLTTARLRDLALATVSCSRTDDYRYSSEDVRARWVFSDPDALNCGYCFPCLIRRAALHRVGLDDSSDYRVDVADAPQVFDAGSDASQDLRAVLAALRRGETADEVLLSGPLPDRVHEHAAVYLRGRQELRDWLSDGLLSKVS